jgi:hypothetical protein
LADGIDRAGAVGQAEAGMALVFGGGGFVSWFGDTIGDDVACGKTARG